MQSLFSAIARRVPEDVTTAGDENGLSALIRMNTGNLHRMKDVWALVRSEYLNLAKNTLASSIKECIAIALDSHNTVARGTAWLKLIWDAETNPSPEVERAFVDYLRSKYPGYDDELLVAAARACIDALFGLFEAVIAKKSLEAFRVGKKRGHSTF